MKAFVFILCFYLSILSVSATNASKFIEKIYAESHGNRKTHITVKREHTEQAFQFIGEKYINAITFGYGDIKISGCKKCRITYICFLNCNLEPFWGWIIPR